MKLVHVEIRRLLARRLLRILVLLVLVGLAFVVGKTGYDSQPPSAADRANAEQTAAQQRASMPPLAQQRADCERQKGQPNGPPADFDCAQAVHEPRAADFLQDNIFRFAGQAHGLLEGFGVVLALAGFLIGASSIGAEWSAGTLAALLTWEPRRLRVLATKAVALLAVLGVFGVVVEALDFVGLFGVAAWRGDTHHVTTGLVTALLLICLRGVVLGVGAALGGYALAGLLRSTSAALGVGFAYFVGAEIALRNLWHHAEPWLLTTNVAAWLRHGQTVYEQICRADGSCEGRPHLITFAHGTGYLAVLLAVVLAAFAVTFRRRDVT